MPDKIIEMPDGRIVSFPGGMPDDAIAAALRGTKQVVPQQVLDNLKAKASQKTQFELDRPGSNRPGGGGFGQFMNTLGSMFTPSGDMQGLERSNMGPQNMAARQENIKAQAAQDAIRQQRGYGSGYRAVAPFVPGSPQMEESALRGDPSGVLGAAGAPTSLAVAAYAGPKVVRGIREALPSTERAGMNFQQVMDVAGSKPVSVEAIQKVADRAQQLANSGGQLPKVISDFMKRASAAEPVTYAEARDFASNASRLSSGEFGNLNPTMQRQVNIFSKALNEAIGETAEGAGVGPQYRGAMKEYAAASRNKARMEAAKKYLAKAAPLAAGAYLAGKEISTGK